MYMQPTMPAMVATTGNDNGLSPLIALAMLGGRGFGGGFGNDCNRGGNWGGSEGCLTPTNFTAGITGVTDAIQNTEVMSSLGDIKASVPLAEAQVQLALAGATADINGNIFNASQSVNANIATGLQTAIQGQAGINKNISDSLASAISVASANRETTLAVGNQLGTAILNSKFELSQVINNDGEKTRALISSIENVNTQRLLGERQDLINELQAEGRRRDDRHGIEINMTNNQNQQQLQFQAQQQQINSLFGCMHGIDQNIRATNQQLIIGNTGVATGGAQTSNPTNVKA